MEIPTAWSELGREGGWPGPRPSPLCSAISRWTPSASHGWLLESHSRSQPPTPTPGKSCLCPVAVIGPFTWRLTLRLIKKKEKSDAQLGTGPLFWAQLKPDIGKPEPKEAAHPQVLNGLWKISSISWRSKQEVGFFNAEEADDGVKESQRRPAPWRQVEHCRVTSRSSWETPDSGADPAVPARDGQDFLVNKQPSPGRKVETKTGFWVSHAKTPSLIPKAQPPILPPLSLQNFSAHYKT